MNGVREKFFSSVYPVGDNSFVKTSFAAKMIIHRCIIDFRCSADVPNTCSVEPVPRKKASCGMDQSKLRFALGTRAYIYIHWLES